MPGPPGGGEVMRQNAHVGFKRLVRRRKRKERGRLKEAQQQNNKRCACLRGLPESAINSPDSVDQLDPARLRNLGLHW